MSDWIEILKNRLENESLPLPEDDWEWFEAKFRQRKRRMLLAWSSTAAAAMAATVALIILLPTGKPEEEFTVVGKGPEIALVNPDPVSEPVPEPVVRQDHQPEKQASKTEGPVQEPIEVVPESNQTPESNPVPEPAEGGALSEVEGTEPLTMETFDFGPEETTTPRRRITISPYAGVMRQRANGGMDATRSMDMFQAGLSEHAYSNSGLSGNPSDILYPTPTAFHIIPVSFGLEVSVPLVRKLSLTSGVDLTLFKSQFSGMMPSGENSISQRAYYLGIPLRLDLIAWENGPTSIWVGAGGKVDRLIGGKYGSVPLKDNSFHWSATGVAGFDHELIRGLSLFFQPAISYYFKPSSPAVLTYRTEHPLLFSLTAGFRIDL